MDTMEGGIPKGYLKAIFGDQQCLNTFNLRGTSISHFEVWWTQYCGTTVLLYSIRHIPKRQIEINFLECVLQLV